MAIAEKTLAAQFNRPGHDIVDHYTYAFMGDGCMMEGISHECAPPAGTLKLGKLVAFCDDNGISIDGHIEGCNSPTIPRNALKPTAGTWCAAWTVTTLTPSNAQ